MTKEQEALKLALEALEWAVEQAGGPLCEHESGGACCFCKENNAITAIKEALAQPVEGLDEAAIRADEREACAKLCDEARAARLAEQIRARGNT